MPAWKIIATITGLYVVVAVLSIVVFPAKSPTPQLASPTENAEPVGSVKGAADFCDELTNDIEIDNPLYAEDFRQGCFERTVDKK